MKAVKHALFFAGIASATYGSWLMYRPLGWIIGGILVTGFALFVDRLLETRQQQ